VILLSLMFGHSLRHLDNLATERGLGLGHFLCLLFYRERSQRKKERKISVFSSQSRFVCSIVIVWDVVKLQFINGYGSEECCVKQSRLIVICIIV